MLIRKWDVNGGRRDVSCGRMDVVLLELCAALGCARCTLCIRDLSLLPRVTLFVCGLLRFEGCELVRQTGLGREISVDCCNDCDAPYLRYVEPVGEGGQGVGSGHRKIDLLDIVLGEV
jgi:hypothetical protein